jgi:hypothetical protein
MSFWLREIAGWLLVLAGVWVFWEAYQMLLAKRIFEAAPMTLIGFIVFRGGIHLLKVAIAAQAARALPDANAAPTRRTTRSAGRPIGPTPARAVVPGPKTGGARREAAGRRE